MFDDLTPEEKEAIMKLAEAKSKLGELPEIPLSRGMPKADRGVEPIEGTDLFNKIKEINDRRAFEKILNERMKRRGKLKE